MYASCLVADKTVLITCITRAYLSALEARLLRLSDIEINVYFTFVDQWNMGLHPVTVTSFKIF